MAITQDDHGRLSAPFPPSPGRSSTTAHHNAKRDRQTNHSDHASPPPTATILTAKPTDLTYITSLARQHVNNIGFVPTAALLDHIDRQSIALLLINDQPAGYLLSSGGIRRPYRIIQVAITDEMWRMGYGTQLIAHARATAATRPIPSVSASIRDRLPMQDVARNTGAQLVKISTRPTARQRILTHWIWQPLRDLQPNPTATVIS